MEKVTSKMKFNSTHARESFKINQELLNYQPTQWYIYLCTSHVCNRLSPHNIFYRPVSQFRTAFQFIRSSISFFVGRGGIVRTCNNYQIFTQQNIISNYNKNFANENDRISQLKKALPIREYNWTPVPR